MDMIRTLTVLPSPLHKEEQAQTDENKANHRESGRGTDLCYKLQAAKIHLLGELRQGQMGFGHREMPFFPFSMRHDGFLKRSETWAKIGAACLDFS